MAGVSFDWDPAKDVANQLKHDVSFAEAQHAFSDAHRAIAQDLSHSTSSEATLLLLRRMGGRRPESPLHLSGWRCQDHRRRLLA